MYYELQRSSTVITICQAHFTFSDKLFGCKRWREANCHRYFPLKMQLGRNGKATPCWFIRRFLFSWNLPISFQASHNFFIIATDNLIGALINDNCNVIDSWRIFDWTVIILQRSMKNKYFIQWNNPILLSHSQSCYKQFVFFSKYIPTPLSTGWC